MLDKFKNLSINVKLGFISFALGFIALCLILVGQSYAIFSGTFTDTNNQVVKLGNLEVVLNEPSTGIDLGLSPLSDVDGLLQEEVYTFTVENKGSVNSMYKVLIIDDETSKASYSGTLLSKDIIRVGLEINGEEQGPYKLSELNELLNEKEIKSGKKDTYKLRLWIDESANIDDISEQQIFLKLKLEAEQYFSNIVANLDESGANEPVLTENMIPVYYDSTSSSWKKADTSNTNETYKWYDYDNKMWANAVTVTETNRSTYLSANVGTEINMDDINTMWVWIPRYTYTYLKTNTPQEIDIKFEKGTESTGTIKCIDAVASSGTTSETCTDTTNGSLVAGTSTYTHPAFTFGDTELTGLWVGKFESSATTIPTSTSTSTSTTESTVIIKPNVQSLRYKAVSYQFRDARQMEKANNVYGFPQSSSTTFNWNGNLTGDTNNIDIHMMKNTEWGAVTYLYHSKYGRCTNGACEELTINNCSTYTTGIGADTVSAGYLSTTCTTDKNKYNGASGVKASTTGNVYGVYDMSGGLWEYTMGNIVNSSNQFQASSATYWSTTTYPLSKYYDSYTYNDSNTTYTKGKLGDATVEMAPTGTSGNWYSDYASFPFGTGSWFERGGLFSYDTSAGAFNFSYSTGAADTVVSFRVSIVPQAS